jgi:uroporphyrinogen decarboxylase
MKFEPDYRHFADVMRNVKPARLPIYEHILCAEVMEEVLGTKFVGLHNGDAGDINEFFKHHCNFFKKMTYDVVSYEFCLREIFPNAGALEGGGAGPIQNRSDFDSYPWDELPKMFWAQAGPRLDALAKNLPAGMKAVGGVGNGVFELVEDLVGLEYLPLMSVDDPELYSNVFRNVGDLMCTVWSELLKRYADSFVVCRFGDDLGFKTSLLTDPPTIRQQIFPQYKRLIKIYHDAGLPFLYHSCGCIFEVMDEIIDLGIDAKHSNEDSIAPFDRWIDDYGDRIGLIGGIDMSFLCSANEQEVYDRVLEDGRRFREKAKGYALGSGNSIPKYVPAANYLAMIRASQEIRRLEESQ